jgi:hypothetical protein
MIATLSGNDKQIKGYPGVVASWMKSITFV